MHQCIMYILFNYLYSLSSCHSQKVLPLANFTKTEYKRFNFVTE